MPSIKALLRTRLGVPDCAVSSRPLTPLNLVILSDRGVYQRVFKIAKERSGSRCAPISIPVSNRGQTPTPVTQGRQYIRVESQRLNPEQCSREAKPETFER
jgi:hypothetical protein